jgi:hypothetical protein
MQWKAFRFFDVSEVNLAEEERTLLADVRFGGIVHPVLTKLK